MTLSTPPSATTAVAVEEDNCVRLGGGDSGSSFAALANNTWSAWAPCSATADSGLGPLLVFGRLCYSSPSIVPHSSSNNNSYFGWNFASDLGTFAFVLLLLCAYFFVLKVAGTGFMSLVRRLSQTTETWGILAKMRWTNSAPQSRWNRNDMMCTPCGKGKQDGFWIPIKIPA